MNWNRSILSFLSVVLIFTAIGCKEEKRQTHVPSWTCSFGCNLCTINQHERQTEELRTAKLHEMRSRLSSSFFLGAVGYLCIGLLGPSMSEGARKIVAEQFKMSREDQLVLAQWIYWIVIGFVFILSIFSSHLGAVRPAVWLLLGGTAYPFFVHVLPSIASEDKMRRKAAMAQIKSFLMLIFIFYVILSFLSPEGFGDIKIQ